MRKEGAVVLKSALLKERRKKKQRHFGQRKIKFWMILQKNVGENLFYTHIIFIYQVLSLYFRIILNLQSELQLRANCCWLLYSTNYLATFFRSVWFSFLISMRWKSTRIKPCQIQNCCTTSFFIVMCNSPG